MNACECEPYITADDALLCSYPEQIFRGLAALDAALHPDRRVIAVEDNKSEAIAILRRGTCPTGREWSWPSYPPATPRGRRNSLSRPLPAGRCRRPSALLCGLCRV